MFSNFSWIIIIFFLLIFKYGFLQPLKDKKLFRLYEARDNVALAAIEGKISQDAEEYRFVINKINFSLYYLKNNYDFSIVVKNIFYYPEKVQKYFSEMYELVEKYDFLVKNYKLSHTYLSKNLNIRLCFLMGFIIKPIFYVLTLANLFLKLLIKINIITTKFSNAIERRIRIIIEIQKDYGNYRNNASGRVI